MPPGCHAFRYFDLIDFTTHFYTFWNSFWVAKAIKKRIESAQIRSLLFHPILVASCPASGHIFFKKVLGFWSLLSLKISVSPARNAHFHYFAHSDACQQGITPNDATHILFTVALDAALGAQSAPKTKKKRAGTQKIKKCGKKVLIFGPPQKPLKFNPSPGNPPTLCRNTHFQKS